VRFAVPNSPRRQDSRQVPSGASVTAIFEDPAIQLIHARNVYAGCFMLSISRA